MRFFYIVIFFSLTVNFAALASQKIVHRAKNLHSKISLPTNKNSNHIKSDYGEDDESFQKDIINHTILKESYKPAALMIFFAIVSFYRQIIPKKIVVKRLKYKYWCLLKLLYPKHVFW